MSYVDALLIERAGYARRGLKDRVAEVDAEIKRLGGGVVVADDPAEVAPQGTVTKASRKQTTR